MRRNPSAGVAPGEAGAGSQGSQNGAPNVSVQMTTYTPLEGGPSKRGMADREFQFPWKVAQEEDESVHGTLSKFWERQKVRQVILLKNVLAYWQLRFGGICEE